jgi:hypothetical protein
MKGANRYSIGVAVTLAGIALGELISPASLVMAQPTGLKDMTYVSPTWGFEIRWYSSEWTVANESSDGEADILILEDGLGSSIEFSGIPQSGSDAQSCLDGMIEEALAVPGAVDAETVLNEYGEPFTWSEPNQAYTLFQIRIPVDDALQDHAVYLECQTLVPGEAVFQRAYSGPVGVFDQWYEEIAETVEGVSLPASAWWPRTDSPGMSAGLAPLLGDWRANGDVLPGGEEEPQLLVSQVDAAGDVYVVTFENLGANPVRIDPANVVLTVSSMTESGSGLIQRPYATAWDDGQSLSADGSRVLTPGERATVQVSIAPIDDSALVCNGLLWASLEYHQPEGRPAVLVSTPVERCLEGVFPAVASAGRPILRLSR